MSSAVYSCKLEGKQSNQLSNQNSSELITSADGGKKIKSHTVASKLISFFSFICMLTDSSGWRPEPMSVVSSAVTKAAEMAHSFNQFRSNYCDGSTALLAIPVPSQNARERQPAPHLTANAIRHQNQPHDKNTHTDMILSLKHIVAFAA